MTLQDGSIVDVAKRCLESARRFQQDVPRIPVPRASGGVSVSDAVIPRSFTPTKRQYIDRLIHQLNGSYENGYFDACAVMLRRLLELLIIEVFEHVGRSTDVQDVDGDFLMLSDLVGKMLSGGWSLSRSTKRALPRLKSMGDKSAHGRYYIAHRADIDRSADDIRAVVQELLFLADLS